jgi:hypothetical protein
VTYKTRLIIIIVAVASLLTASAVLASESPAIEKAIRQAIRRKDHKALQKILEKNPIGMSEKSLSYMDLANKLPRRYREKIVPILVAANTNPGPAPVPSATATDAPQTEAVVNVASTGAPSEHQPSCEGMIPLGQFRDTQLARRKHKKAKFKQPRNETERILKEAGFTYLAQRAADGCGTLNENVDRPHKGAVISSVEFAKNREESMEFEEGATFTMRITGDRKVAGER